MLSIPDGVVASETVAIAAYWIVRALQILLSIVALGLVSTMFVQFQHIMNINVPTPFTYNFACALLTVFILPTFLLFDLPERLKPKKIAWLRPKEVSWQVRWIFDIFMWIFWVAGAATSALHCPDLCSAGEGRYPSGTPFEIWFAGVVCACNGYIFGEGGKPDVNANEHWVYQANRGVDIVIVLLFSAMIVADPLKPSILPKLRRRDQPPTYDTAYEPAYAPAYTPAEQEAWHGYASPATTTRL